MNPITIPATIDMCISTVHHSLDWIITGGARNGIIGGTACGTGWHCITTTCGRNCSETTADIRTSREYIRIPTTIVSVCICTRIAIPIIFFFHLIICFHFFKVHTAEFTEIRRVVTFVHPQIVLEIRCYIRLVSSLASLWTIKRKIFLWNIQVDLS